MCPRRKVPFRMLSRLSTSGNVRHLKLIGNKLRIQMDFISNTTTAASDLGNIEHFSTNLAALETLMISSLTCDSEDNDVELLEILLSVNNSETDVQMISRSRSELRSSDGRHHFLFSNFFATFVRSVNPFLASSALCIAVLLLLERVKNLLL